MSKPSYRKTLKKHGRFIVEKIDTLAKEGNIRRVVIKNKSGREIVRFPLTLGVAAAVLAPVFVSIGVIAFFLTESTLRVEKRK